MPKAIKTNEEIGSSGLQIFGGVVAEEFLPKLRGTNFIRVMKEMRDNDPIVGAILYGIEKLILQAQWSVDPADGSAAAKREATFIEECMEDMTMTWPELISEILTMLPFGWAFHEIVYRQRNEASGSKFSDNRYGWHKMPLRAQDTLQKWEMGPNGQTHGMHQQTTTGHYAYIPLEKALLFRTQAHKGNPQGRSILRNAYRPWYYMNHMEEIEGIGVERDLAGLPVIYLEPSYMADDAPAWKKAIFDMSKDIVTKLRRDEQEGLVLPSAVDADGNQLIRLELLSAGGARAFDTTGIIERYARRIAMTVLADFILLGHENVGSFALSSDKTDIFAITLDSILRTIRDVFNNYAVPRLLKLNGVDPKLSPTLKYGDLEDRPLEQIITFLQGLTGMGVPLFPDQDLAEYLLDLAKIPHPKHRLDGSWENPNAPATPGEEGVAPLEEGAEEEELDLSGLGIEDLDV